MKKLFVLLPVLLSFFFAKAQYQDVHISLEAQGIATTNNVVPFWLRANQFGSVPLSGGSGSLIGKIRKDYDTTKTYGWAFSFEGRGNAGKESNFLIIEGLIKAHAGIFELKAGRSKDIVGLVDSSLSSGAFSISGNALGIPKVSLGIPDYYSIPVLDGLFAVKATLANGYIDNIKVRIGKIPTNFKGYYLENKLYVRLGKPSWRLKLQAGYNHEALYGDEKRVFGSKYQLSAPATYWYVLTGKLYEGSKVGNHLGSLDVGAEYKFDALTVSVYRQNFYDIGALKSLANIQDGLNGVSLVNNEPRSDNFYWKKFLVEFLYTVNQAGTLGSKPTKSGAENYYNNYEYAEGWSYHGVGLGTPFITSINDVKDKEGKTWQYFINNRVLALNAGAQVYVHNWFYTARLSYSKNMGTFENGSEIYLSLGGKPKYPSKFGTFKKVNQYSAFVEGMRLLKNGYSIGYDLAYDQGGLLYNSFGIILKVSKTFM